MNGMNFQQLFAMIANPGGSRPVNHKKIVVKQDFPADQQQLNHYSDQIKQIYHEIFIDDDQDEQDKSQPINLETKLKFKIKRTPMPVCNKILTAQQMVFRCYDCMAHESSVICTSCFENGNHKGHRYSQIASGGGNCDCGNPDAIKPSGFCVKHPGKADPVIIDEKEEEHFIQVCSTIFEWIFRMHETNMSKSSDILGQLLAGYLIKINEQSLYYNTLTYKLLYSKRRYALQAFARNQTIIEKVFQYGIKMVNFAKKMTDLFFNMFSLEVFKYELTVSFTEAYNTLQKFEESKFRNLYIQLYANNDIVEKLIQKQVMLYPYSRQYDYQEYMQHLVFLSSIKPSVASKYFVMLMRKGSIKFPELDLIQSRVQEGNSHIIQVTNQNLNNQNSYYTVIESILTLVKDSTQTLIQMAKNYMKVIMGEQYSYKKNKLVMPFHKILAMILMTLYKGNLNGINFLQIQTFLGHSNFTKDIFSKQNTKQPVKSLTQMFSKIFRLILQCWREFATTFFESCYFDNYSPLYVRSGNTIIVYDMLMLLICINMFEQTKSKQEMNQILTSIFQLKTYKLEKQKQKMEIEGPLEQKMEQKQNLNQAQKIQTIQAEEDQWEDLAEDSSDDVMDDFLQEQLINMDGENLNQKLQKQSQLKLKILRRNTELMKILIETSISDRAQVLVSNSLKIQNMQSRAKTQRLFIELMNNFKQVNPDNLKIIQKNFVQTKNFEKDMIEKFLVFDKNKKKYTINQSKDLNLPTVKLPLHLYPTMKKLGGIFAVQSQEAQRDVLQSITLQKQHISRLKTIFNEDFLEHLIKLYVGEITEQKNVSNKQIKSAFLEFFQVLKTIQILIRYQHSSVINEFFSQMVKLSERPEYQFLNQKLKDQAAIDTKELQKQIKMKKFNDKKRKRIEEMKKKQDLFSEQIKETKDNEVENQTQCIICREDDKNAGLTLLASFNYSNIFQSINQVQGRYLVFNSCFHPIHVKCFKKSSKQLAGGNVPCPLCKSQSNIILPLEKQIQNLNMINEIFERISVLKAVIQQNYEGFDAKYEQFGIISIFRSLCSIIVKNIIKKQPILNHRDQRLANILYNLARTMYYKLFTQLSIQKQSKGIQDFIVSLEQKILTQKSPYTHLYALQYVTINILHSCFTLKPLLNNQSLNLKHVSFINKQDFSKIWQMCNQIVSLPNVNLNNFQASDQLSQISQKVNLYRPPQTVLELIKIRDENGMRCKNGHQMCICIVCKKKGCYECKKISIHMKKVHCGEGITFNLLTGGLLYFCDGRSFHIPSLYCNQIGIEWRPSKSAQKFVLDNDSYEQIKNQILNQTLLKYLLQKYPDSMKKNFLQQMQ